MRLGRECYHTIYGNWTNYVRCWGRVQVLPRSAFDSRPYIKSCRPGLLVLVSNRCLCAVGVEYRYYQGLHSIPDLTFCAVNCTTRHLVSSDLNKSCRPGLLVLVSYIKCLKVCVIPARICQQ